MRPLSAPPTPTEQTQPETSGGRPHAPKRGAARSLSPRHPKGDLHAQGAIAESGDHCRPAKLLRVWLSDGGYHAVGVRSRLIQIGRAPGRARVWQNVEIEVAARYVQ